MEIFLILPTQLFDARYFNKKYHYILWEHPHYFKKYNYNKKKLLLHRASMKYFLDYLKSKKYKIDYVSFNEKIKNKIKFLNKNNNNKNKNKILLFDPIDKISFFCKNRDYNYEYIESPNFLLTKEHYAKHREKTDKFFFNSFYMWGKKQINLIPDIKSQDKLNRKKIPKNIKIPPLPNNLENNNKNKNKNKIKSSKYYIEEASYYINKNFKSNYGNTDNFIFPITHKVSKKWLKDFIKNKLKDFGNYQDSITQTDNHLFHSILSTSINIGLINPSDIIQEIIKNKILLIKKEKEKEKEYNKKSKIPLNSLEGYIRQLFWREYQRYCYIYFNFKNKNYFGNKKKITKKWYIGDVGVKPVDDCIIKAFNSGYLHHIERLMIMGNYMNLCEIKPLDGFKWFMEFACDSYEWVMCQNVLEMVFFISGGKTTRKPYISSSNYILKMSDYKKEKEKEKGKESWNEKWDNKYHSFLKKNKKKLWKFRYHFPSLKYF